MFFAISYLLSRIYYSSFFGEHHIVFWVCFPSFINNEFTQMVKNYKEKNK